MEECLLPSSVDGPKVMMCSFAMAVGTFGDILGFNFAQVGTVYWVFIGTNTKIIPTAQMQCISCTGYWERICCGFGLCVHFIDLLFVCLFIFFLLYGKGFVFSENEQTALEQFEGGPCAVIAPVQV